MYYWTIGQARLWCTLFIFLSCWQQSPEHHHQIVSHFKAISLFVKPSDYFSKPKGPTLTFSGLGQIIVHEIQLRRTQTKAFGFEIVHKVYTNGEKPTLFIDIWFVVFYLYNKRQIVPLVNNKECILCSLDIKSSTPCSAFNFLTKRTNIWQMNDVQE